MQDHTETDAEAEAEPPVERVAWLDTLGAGAMALVGAGIFVLSIGVMAAVNQIGSAMTGIAGVPEAEIVAFEAPPPSIATLPPLVDAPAWLANAESFSAQSRTPLIAIVVLDDGTHSEAASRAMAWRDPISFAVAADFDGSPYRVQRVRRSGREALALLPFGHGPEFGSDPNVLQRGLSEAELLRRLRWHLARAGEGIVGAVDQHAGDIVRDASALRSIGAGLAASGMLMIDSRSDPDSMLSARLRPMGVPIGQSTTRIARGDTLDAGTAALTDAERHAFTWGAAIVLVEAGDVPMRALAQWLRSRSESIALAPVSHVIRRLRTGPAHGTN